MGTSGNTVGKIGKVSVQGEIRKPSSVINAKKEENNRMGKTRISSRNLEIPREHFMQRWVQ